MVITEKCMNKKILIINGSPRAHGNTETIVDSFIKGAEEAGSTAVKINIQQMDIHPCLGCYGCQMGKGSPCVQKDDMQKVYDAWKDAHTVVFASPIYWMHFTAQFKNVLDRLFASTALNAKTKDSVLVLTAASEAEEISQYGRMAESYYEYLLGVLGYQDRGRILAYGFRIRFKYSNPN
ncbi:MAG: reductase [Oscillospiraceae bacterium]|nr:reductase [Oscillospiraceae bacterium]